MKLDGCKLLEDNEREFRVQHPEHGEMRIAKDHLHHLTVQRIQQHFAEGGEVKAQPPPGGPLEALKRLVGRPSGQQSSSPSVFDTAGAVKEHNKRLDDAANAEKMYRGGAVKMAEGGEVDTPGEVGPITVSPDEAAAILGVPPLPSSAPTSPGAPVLPPELQGLRNPRPPATQTASLVQPQAPQAPPPAQPMPQEGAPSRELTQGVKQEVSGIQAQGAAAQEQAKQEAAAYEQRQAGLQKMQGDFETQYAANTADVAKLRTEILNGQTDPNRLWHNAGTGQKITASIGMILGGIGAALTHGPNYAMQVIDKLMDRDLEAQKMDLGKKESMLSSFMQQGHQLQTSFQMAKAFYMDSTAAQLMKAAAQGGGAKAAGIAQQLAGEAHQRADQMRRQAILQNLQIESTKLSMGFQRAQMGALGQLMSGTSGGGTNLDPRAEALLPEEFRSRIVRLGDGSATLARTPKDAEEVKKTQESTAILRDKLQRYNEILQRHQHGVSQVLSNEDYNTAQSLHESILTDINGLAGLNRFTHEEAQIFAGRVPDITSKQIFKGHQAKLKELGKEIDDKVWETNKTHLSLGQQRRPGG